MDIDHSIYRRKHKSPIDRVRQALRSLKMDVDAVDSGQKRGSAPVFGTDNEVFNYSVLVNSTQLVCLPFSAMSLL